MPTPQPIISMLTEEITGLYTVEIQLLRLLPKLIAAAVDPALKTTMAKQLLQTAEDLARLKRIAAMLGISPFGHLHGAVLVLMADEGDWLDQNWPDNTGDARLIGLTLKIEHFLNASYVNACVYARMVDASEIAQLLEVRLDQSSDLFLHHPVTARDALTVNA